MRVEFLVLIELQIQLFKGAMEHLGLRIPLKEIQTLWVVQQLEHFLKYLQTHVYILYRIVEAVIHVLAQHKLLEERVITAPLLQAVPQLSKFLLLNRPLNLEVCELTQSVLIFIAGPILVRLKRCILRG